MDTARIVRTPRARKRLGLCGASALQNGDQPCFENEAAKLGMDYSNNLDDFATRLPWWFKKSS